jgi:hydrogenase maturation protein HypF
MLPDSERVLLRIRGRVQGVGFRPFIYRLAQHYALVGSISNTSAGVLIDVQGSPDALSQFQQAIVSQKPERAAISDFSVRALPVGDFVSFQIATSGVDEDTALALLPDTALCSLCLQELFDPTNRRYQYPFLHCTGCGPRFSLFARMPFDRDHTAMREFVMCSACQSEYEDPSQRRFYAQTNCCSACGPKLQLVDAEGRLIAEGSSVLEQTALSLQQGKIVALKNTGGYLLLVDATDAKAVERLRLRKRRLHKPFALLMPDLVAIEAIAHLSAAERTVLTAPAAPIVFLRKKASVIAAAVAHQSPYYGVMLPHSALQHLLLRLVAKPLVATSGNLSGGALCITEQEAFETLGGVADLFLIHNRSIVHPLDDSIVHVMAGQPVLIRKARGYIPDALPIAGCQETLFAAGSHRKNTFAFVKQGLLYTSQHMGDLDSASSCRAYEKEISSWQALLGIEQCKGVADKHPAYYSTLSLQKRGLLSERVQHHKAHVWAAQIDHQLEPPFSSIVWDGTGWGDDGTIWGGETFSVTETGIQRVASLYPFLLPGGEKAVREPRRSLLGLAYALYGTALPAFVQELFTREELILLLSALQKQVHAPVCSSMGRLFDGVSALLGLCTLSDFEGQAALLLEQAAYEGDCANGSPLPLIRHKELFLLDWRPLIRDPIVSAAAFHETLARAMVSLAMVAGHETVLLTGGVMQNKGLVEKALERLNAAGFKPRIHRHVPPNDGGIAVGQLRRGTCA